MAGRVRPDIAAAMYQRHHDARAEEPPREHIGGSDLAQGCPRRIWYTWRRAKQEDFSGQMLRLFHRGHREEPELIADLQGAGIDVSDTGPDGEQWTWSVFGGRHRVNLDGIAMVPVDLTDPMSKRERRILEFKTMNKRRFEETADLGVALAMPGYYRQMQTQLAVTRLAGQEFDGCLFVAVCKDNDKFHVEDVDPDTRTMGHLIRMVKRIVEGGIPDRLDRNKGPCRWCHFAKICHDRRWDLVDRNCWSCSNARSTESGWICAAGHPFGETCDAYCVDPDF